MKVLRSLDDLARHFQGCGSPPRYLADTGFLYALAYDDDRLFNQANDVLDFLHEQGASLYVNVISRMEFIDLIFRKQVTQGCIQLFGVLKRESQREPIYGLLKDIRDKDTAARRQNHSFKIDERRLKKLRQNVEQAYGVDDWRDFCKKFVGSMLVNEWTLLEEDLGLNFVEVMEDGVSDLFHSPLRWNDLVQLMGDQGLRGADAMIVNLFSKSKFPVLITSDSDFESCLSDPLVSSSSEKAIFLLAYG
ncbi:hypothetical protein [Candidatus Nitronereus thalassa]|jgi:predicted nucleic acid-binding protein|uniref:PIN domain-containing protein n=1 Tax=Candidatus Nitronereus thalassa TaxID=3020898 RepID=A0ABU3K944_9BACT|nr:hypothetical protein [Candidatus Nitronereus thalassa]MDT7042916.1 hypothetical protein [Candidatus Nitronereus thalassa]GJL80209.1 MAG: hypothetical protein NPINA01_31980 [Nitrospinaceae bacterium]